MTTDTAVAATTEAAPGALATAATDTATADAFAVDAADATTTAATEGEGGEEKTGEETKAPEGAPETYADFTMPEGVALDSALLAEFVPVLKELNLPQNAAQKVMDFAPKLITATIEGIKAQLVEEATGWHDATRQDKEIGGDKMAERIAVANKAFEQFGTPELKAFLASKGLHAHPEIIRAFYRAGKAISEDTFVPGGSASPAARSTAEMLYPTKH